MSLSYKAAEAALRAWNKITRGGTKKRIEKKYKNPQNNVDLAKYFEKGFLIEQTEESECTVYKISPKEKASQTVCLYIAGGEGCHAPEKRHFKTIARLIKKSGCTVYLPCYPLAPQHNVRYALRFLQKLYSTILLSARSQDIVFAGDGAGANLVLSLCQRVSRKPAKLIVISPKPGTSDSRRNSLAAQETLVQAQQDDPLLSYETEDFFAGSWLREVPETSPDAEPLCIDYRGFPLMQLFYSTRDIYAPFMGALIQTVQDAGCTVQENAQPMCHAWATLQGFAEGRRAVRTMASFILGK